MLDEILKLRVMVDKRRRRFHRFAFHQRRDIPRVQDRLAHEMVVRDCVSILRPCRDRLDTAAGRESDASVAVCF